MNCSIKLGMVSADQPTLWVLGGHPGDTIYFKKLKPKSISTWLCGSQSVDAVASPNRTLALSLHSGSRCPFVALPCLQTTPSNTGATQFFSLLATFDASGQQQASALAWEVSPPLNLAMIPFNQEPAAVELGFDAALENLFTANAVQNLFDRSIRGEQPVEMRTSVSFGIAHCPTSGYRCYIQHTDGLAAHRPRRPACAASTLGIQRRPAPTLPAGRRNTDDLIIVDSPLPVDLGAVSR